MRGAEVVRLLVVVVMVGVIVVVVAGVIVVVGGVMIKEQWLREGRQDMWMPG
jgi:hypothetical protein